MSLYRHLCFVVLVLATSFPALASQVDLTIYTEEFPPYNYMDDKVVRGINADILREACIRAGITCRFELLSWQRAYKRAQQDIKGGVASTARLPQREGQWHWLGPLVAGTSCLFKLKNREDIVIQRVEDILPFTMDVQRSDVYDTLFSEWGFEPDRNFLYFDTKQEGFAALLRKEVDLFIASDITIYAHLDRHGLDITDIVPVFEIPMPPKNGNYLAINKQADLALVDTLQRALDSMYQKEGYERVKRSYTGAEKAFQARPELNEKQLYRRCY